LKMQCRCLPAAGPQAHIKLLKPSQTHLCGSGGGAPRQSPAG
jgi:hypothetical protein